MVEAFVKEPVAKPGGLLANLEGTPEGGENGGFEGYQFGFSGSEASNSWINLAS
jgi:hypothetical protein